MTTKKTKKPNNSCRISKHSEIANHSEDWCYLCGERSAANVDVWWAENAEHKGNPISVCHDKYDMAHGRYLRICVSCAEKIVVVGKQELIPPQHSHA